MNFIFAIALLFAIANIAMAAPTTPDEADPQKLLQLAKANDDFGLKLLHQLELKENTESAAKQDDPKNLFISPFSVSTILSLLMAGGANETHDEIHKTLG